MALCTIQHVKDAMSDYGVAAFSTDSFPFVAMDASRVNRFIARSEQEIFYYLTKYDTTALSGNVWLQWVCATFTAFHLSCRGNQTPSAALNAARLEYKEQLDEIRSGLGQVPGAMKSPEDIPGMSNLRIDPRYSVHRQRVEMPISSGRSSSTRRIAVDRTAEWEMDY